MVEDPSSITQSNSDILRRAYAGGWALAVLLFIVCLPCAGQTSTPPSPSGGGSAAPEDQPSPVVLDGKRIFDIRVPFKGASTQERAAMNSARIKRFADDWSISPDSISAIETDLSSDIMVGDRVIMSVLEIDARVEGVTRQELAADHALKIRAAIQQFRQDYSSRRLITASLLALATTLVLVFILWIGIRSYSRLLTSFIAWAERRLASSRLETLGLIQPKQVNGAITGFVRLVRFLALLGILYAYLQLLLSFFPWTRGFADRLLELVLTPVKTLATGIWDQVPKLFFIAVVAIITNYALKLLRVFFAAIQNGTIVFQNFYPDWAQPTYKILRWLVVAFAVMISYPYIPGSSSDAFKGISIFLGILLSLGSTSLVGNIVAGLMMTYMRAFKPGDRVKIGEYTGDVVLTRLQVTHLRTVKNEEIVIPNSIVINGHILNYSSEARTRGLILHTSVTIGYDAPWRQVHALLLMAAEKTPGLLREPAPFVLQKSLDDFYVNYELNVYTDTPQAMPRLYSDLHQNIQDAFNDYGVQIMSPNYVADRAAPTLVPKDQWYAAPAKRSLESNDGRVLDVAAADGTMRDSGDH